MSHKLEFTKPHKLSLLHDELLAAGITPEVVEGRNDTVTLTLPDTADTTAVQAVVDAHDPTATPRRRVSLKAIMDGTDADRVTDKIAALTVAEQVKVLARGWVWSDF